MWKPYRFCLFASLCSVLLSLCISPVRIGQAQPLRTATQGKSKLGKIAYLAGDEQYDYERVLTLIDSDGKNPRKISEACGAGDWSPDGQCLAFLAAPNYKASGTCFDGVSYEIHVLNTVNMTLKVLDNTFSLFNSPLFWSSDSQKIAYVAGLAQEEQLFTVNRDGSNLTQMTNDDTNKQSFLAAWSPDGSQIAYMPFLADSGLALYVVSSDGKSPHAITDSLFKDLDQFNLFWLNDNKIVLGAYVLAAWNIYTVDSTGTEMRHISANGKGEN